ncbi:iron/manganese ABC transporter ATP-binding protein SitB [soil metagenome]
MTLPLAAVEPAERRAGAAVVDDVTLAYGRHVALDATSFTVPSASVTALIGPNGSGKSTLLHALAGLIRPVQGSITVLGAVPARGRRRVAYVLQSTQVNEQMAITVQEVVTMGRYAECGWLGRLRRADRDAIDAAMERMGVTDLARRPLHELSGGQRQRVFVAQGLAQGADLVLLDEPVTGLDLLSRRRILDAMHAERAAGRTVVFSTHDLGEASSADHLLLLAGHLVAAGPPAAVLTSEHLSKAYGGRLVRLADGAVLLDDGAHH